MTPTSWLRTENLQRAVVVFLLVTGFLVAVVPPDRTSAATPPKYLLALGDSLAAGYEPTLGTTVPSINPATGFRDRGYPNSYAADIANARGLNLIDLGCPGETTSSMLGAPAMGQCTKLYAKEFGARSQIGAAEVFLSMHPQQVALVTIDIGANDLQRCVSVTRVSANCLKTNDIATVKNLAAILSSVSSDLHRSDPLSSLVGMDYYDPFLGLAYSPGGVQGAKLAVASLAATNLFNTELDVTFSTFGVRRANVASAFHIDSAVPLGRYGTKLLPANVVSTCELTFMCATTSQATRDIHPNKVGYRTIAAAFEKTLGS